MTGRDTTAMTRFIARQYREGDAGAINRLYRDVTGRVRSFEEFEWQWLAAPAGRGEMWLIEEILAGQSAKLIGHHGVMPLFFSTPGRDFLIGKTENTMVLPEYRNKILYPRFEKEFLHQYKMRFDGLFSTMGPPAALRQRKALGYSDSRHWLRYEWPVRPGALAGMLENRFAARGSPRDRKIAKFLRLVTNILKQAPSRLSRRPAGSLTELTPAEVSSHQFFSEFWPLARNGYGFTPRRNAQDLKWRFWDNPYGDRATLIATGGAYGEGAYAIVRKSSSLRYELEDIAMMPYSKDYFIRILNAVLNWTAEQGGCVLSFATTSDPASPAEFIAAAGVPSLLEKFPMTLLERSNETMLRKMMAGVGSSSDVDLDNWYVTPFVFEGR